mmetsp:Transcript_8329/g.19323  ORF Transcript_8329/g.19323 Transcript_8329/m.19323 type:complete len:236 (+) Transcript_8329:914-1621(+)
MMSLGCSHTVLYFHRRMVYGEPDPIEDEEQPAAHAKSDEEIPEQTVANRANVSTLLVAGLLVACIATHIVASVLDIYEVSSTRGGEERVQEYSIVRIGADFPSSAHAPNDIGVRWMQAMYFLLAVALPISNSILFGLMFLVRWTRKWRDALFLATEINFAWSCIEVLTVSTIFSILQIPKFGNGLIDAGCEQCYVVGSRILPGFAAVCVATVLNVGVNVWLYGKAHSVLYPKPTR